MTAPAKQAVVPTPHPAPVPKRMALANVVKGKQAKPFRVTLYGPPGVGKSTFASQAPKPIFIGTEDGTNELDVERFPLPEGWPDVLEAIRALTEDAHDYRTLVIDTLDSLEQMIWRFITTRDKESNIESYGYSKGYVAAQVEWRLLLAAIERLGRAKPMHVLFLAHSTVKTFKNPAGPDFDRYDFQINAKASAVLNGWCDAVLFAQFETFVTKDESRRKNIGVTGDRVLRTEQAAAYYAKNRYGLPVSLPLDWNAFAKAYKESRQPKETEVQP